MNIAPGLWCGFGFLLGCLFMRLVQRKDLQLEASKLFQDGADAMREVASKRAFEWFKMSNNPKALADEICRLEVKP